MDLRRLRAGEWLAAAAGVALVVSLFLPWYEIGGVDPAHDVTKELILQMNNDFAASASK